MNCIDLKTSLIELFEKQKHCDVLFMCQGGKLAKAHKLILMMASDVFETQIFGKSVQHVIPTGEKVIKLPDIEGKAFKLFLR